MNKRTFKRKLRKQNAIYESKIFGKSNSATLNVEENTRANCMDNDGQCSENDFERGNLSQILFHCSLVEKLKEWCIETKPTKNCVEKLLPILKEEGLNVPLYLARLMGKEKRAIIKNVSSDAYCHIGIENQLKTSKKV